MPRCTQASRTPWPSLNSTEATAWRLPVRTTAKTLAAPEPSNPEMRRSSTIGGGRGAGSPPLRRAARTAASTPGRAAAGSQLRTAIKRRSAVPPSRPTAASSASDWHSAGATPGSGSKSQPSAASRTGAASEASMKLAMARRWSIGKDDAVSASSPWIAKASSPSSRASSTRCRSMSRSPAPSWAASSACSSSMSPMAPRSSSPMSSLATANCFVSSISTAGSALSDRASRTRRPRTASSMAEASGSWRSTP